MTYTKTYHFGATSFSNFVWLNGGALFRNPTILEVEMVTSGAYRVEILDAGEALVAKSYPRDNLHGGWEVFNFGGAGGEFVPPIPEGNFKIRLVNLGTGTRQAHQGVLSMRMPGHPWDEWFPAVASYFGRLFP
jgi:hypothetical protein